MVWIFNTSSCNLNYFMTVNFSREAKKKKSEVCTGACHYTAHRYVFKIRIWYLSQISISAITLHFGLKQVEFSRPWCLTYKFRNLDYPQVLFLLIQYKHDYFSHSHGHLQGKLYSLLQTEIQQQQINPPTGQKSVMKKNNDIHTHL